MNGVHVIPIFTRSYSRVAVLSFLVVLMSICFLATAEAAPRGERFPRPGKHVRDIPRSHVTINVGKSSYRYHRGIFYRPYHRGYLVVRAPIGARVRVLPPGYISFSIGINRYFYVNSAYYLWDPPTREYIVVHAPDGAEAAVSEEGADAVKELFVYPAHGQSVEQTGQDRYECYIWASEQSGFDPSVVEKKPDGRADYNRAFTACLEGRGYTVR